MKGLSMMRDVWEFVQWFVSKCKWTLLIYMASFKHKISYHQNTILGSPKCGWTIFMCHQFKAFWSIIYLSHFNYFAMIKILFLKCLFVMYVLIYKYFLVLCLYKLQIKKELSQFYTYISNWFWHIHIIGSILSGYSLNIF